MKPDTDSLFSTSLVFGAITIVLYFLLVKPLMGGRAAVANTAVAGQAPNAAATGSLLDAATSKTAEKCTRTPLHVSPSSAALAVNGGSNILVDGMLAFKHGRAAASEKQLSAPEQATNRKDRARILSILLADDSTATPPIKGSTIVISIIAQDAGCAKLAQALYLLATYYNLLVLVVVPSDFDSSKAKDQANLLEKLRSTSKDTAGGLTTNVLPDHRIVPCSTVAARVAFVRQVERIGLVIDFDPAVKDQLTRFGHRVVVYDASPSVSTGISRLGSQLFS
jgi:hypothetical protein